MFANMFDSYLSELASEHVTESQNEQVQVYDNEHVHDLVREYILK